MPDHLLPHSNSFGFEMEKDAAGCRALNRNFIVGGCIMPEFSIYFSDLNEDAQKRLLEFYGYSDPEEGNFDFDFAPLCVLNNYEED